MSLYIPGLNLPRANQELWIAIQSDGSLRYNSCGWHDSQQKAIAVQSHGRLVDARYIRDAIIQKWMDKAGDSHMYKCGMEDAYEVIRNAPTIIPVEKGEA